MARVCNSKHCDQLPHSKITFAFTLIKKQHQIVLVGNALKRYYRSLRHAASVVLAENKCGKSNFLKFISFLSRQAK